MAKIDYIAVGNYLLPAVQLSDPPDAPPTGRYGRMRRAFLREHRPIEYSRLVLTEQLFPHLREVDEAARPRLEAITDHEQAHEVILAELVYCRPDAQYPNHHSRKEHYYVPIRIHVALVCLLRKHTTDLTKS